MARHGSDYCLTSSELYYRYIQNENKFNNGLRLYRNEGREPLKFIDVIVVILIMTFIAVRTQLHFLFSFVIISENTGNNSNWLHDCLFIVRGN
jgi:hypothetical protein